MMIGSRVRLLASWTSSAYLVMRCASCIHVLSHRSPIVRRSAPCSPVSSSNASIEAAQRDVTTRMTHTNDSGDDPTVPQGEPALEEAARTEHSTRANRECRVDEIARLVADRSKELNNRLE